ncbi:hypothetical protein K7X08_031334 [Anisodus acutangulus]|uniref:Uncharacterized protein n=1 Tax=Anisodus acutangulus TaxID=402998 RepID=A0A9Q1MRG3_9SOLA|nr:hypothetical protein K7X08_031334 [Anisodus acutangulus]
MDPLTAAALTTAVTTTVSLLVENLSYLISYNCKLIAGVEKSCRDLLEEVKPLNAFLVDNAKLRSNSSQWDVLVDKIRRTVYKAEDVIDKLLVQAKLNEKTHVFKKMVKKTNKDRNFAEEINEILEDVKKILADNQHLFEASPVIDHQPEKVVQEEQGSSLENHEVVGFNEEAEKVISRLFEGLECLDVIPVVGMPGLGKTTLARKIYNDPKIPRRFFSCIWVFVGQSYNNKDILLNILKGFTKRFEEFHDKDEAEIAEEIRGRVANGGKCLIVLDDVWDSNVVDFVKTVFPENNRSHRIMMTTRHEDVARSVNVDPHKLKYLNEKESFQLLEKRAFGNSRCPIELVEHGEGIVEKCSGVPLTIVVIAGALRGRTSELDWKVVKENVGKHLIEEDKLKRCLKIVGLSYNHLPQDRKACFLYFGAFPQGFEIPSWKLIRLWIAEGLIMSNLPGSEIEEIAECYLNDFANRNLVMVMEKRSNGQIKTCRVHDMLHEFCIVQATRLSLIQQVCLTPGQDSPSIQNINTSRRLSIQSSVPTNFISKTTTENHVRSFLCFSSKRKLIDLSNINVQLIPRVFPLIRVLDIESLKFSITGEFYQLFHMRYIAISGDFKELPKLFSCFCNLQTLLLYTSKPTLDIKADIWNMSRLRHLRTNKPANLPPPTISSSCLQTLSLVAPESCKEDVLAKAGNLKKLSIKGKMTALGEFSNFLVLRHLENLTLLNDDMSKALHLPAAFFVYLPKLKKLTLSKTMFEWNEANRLGQLECLEVLKLKESAFMGKSWKMEKEGFRKLQILWIERADFESWEASDCPFPRLRNLVLVSCLNLEAVPLELADLDHLQEMMLDNTSKARESAKEIERKRKEKQTPESVKFKLTIPY